LFLQEPWVTQVSVMTHTQRGDEVIMEAESHVYYYEVGAMAVLSGVQARPVPGKRGVMDPDDVRRAIRERGNIHFPRTSLVVLENTIIVAVAKYSPG